MKEDENKFDEILRGKYSSKNFPFDEENWEKLEGEIDVARRREKIRKASLIFLIGLFAGIAVMIPFVNHDYGNKNKLAPEGN